MPYLNTIIGSRIDWFATQHWKKYFELYDIFELHGIWCICFALDQLKNMIFCYIWDGTYNLIRKFCLPRVLLFSYICQCIDYGRFLDISKFSWFLSFSLRICHLHCFSILIYLLAKSSSVIDHKRGTKCSESNILQICFLCDVSFLAEQYR